MIERDGDSDWPDCHLRTRLRAGLRVWSPSVGTDLRSDQRQEHYLGGLLGGLGLLLTYLLRSSSTDLVVTSVFLVVLIPVLIIDLRHHLMYSVMTLVGFCALWV